MKINRNERLQRARAEIAQYRIFGSIVAAADYMTHLLSLSVPRPKMNYSEGGYAKGKSMEHDRLKIMTMPLDHPNISSPWCVQTLGPLEPPISECIPIS